MGHPGNGRLNVKAQCTITKISIVDKCGKKFNMSCISRIIQVSDEFYKWKIYVTNCKCNSYIIKLRKRFVKNYNIVIVKLEDIC